MNKKSVFVELAALVLIGASLACKAVMPGATPEPGNAPATPPLTPTIPVSRTAVTETAWATLSAFQTPMVPAATTAATPQPEGLGEALPTPSRVCAENLGTIVFSYDPQDMPSVHYGIYSMDAEGGNRVRLSGPDTTHDSMPAWSPERCRIAFVRFTKEGDDDIYVMSADGKTIHRLTTDPGRDMFPDWSPDGKKISFISDRDGSRNLFVMDADGGNPRQLTDSQMLPRTKSGYVQWAQWSPNGDEIAFTYNPGEGQGPSIYLIRPDGSGLRFLAARGMEPAWSPDVNKIYFLSNLSSHVEIWAIHRDGSGLSQVSQFYPNLFPDHSLRVSPDGAMLAFYGTGPEVVQLGTEIYVVNVDGSGLRNISQAKGQDEWLDW